ncbi:hypothetical protein T02_10886 [Trichinella nativa]|uniref:Uncharacterized protein n=1 Tax=Trichinella nativa TaxID=6335 RepID=A0A0V1KQA5_9BILA|nr:hypothetical protein T02_10886 [Trichinella nativa]
MGKQCVRRIESFTRGTHITRIKSLLLQSSTWLQQNMNINSNQRVGCVKQIGVRKEEEKTEVNNTVFVQGIPDIASAQMIAEYFSERLKFPSLWRPSQFLDKSIIEAAEKLSISRKEFVRDLPIEWPKSMLSLITCVFTFEKEEDVNAMLASSRHVSDGYEVKLKDSSGEPRPVVLESWIITEGVCLDERVR